MAAAGVATMFRHRKRLVVGLLALFTALLAGPGRTDNVASGSVALRSSAAFMIR